MRTELRGRPGHNAGERLPPAVLTRPEVRALLAAPRGHAWAEHRNRALWAVMYGAGLRVAEALALRLTDLDHARGLVHVRRGKGGHARTVGIDAGCLAIVQGFTGTAPADRLVFTTRAGGELWPQYVRQALARAGERADILGRCHPHALRHSLAAHLAADGVPMPVIQAQLGHRSLATTSVYLAHISPTELAETLGARDALAPEPAAAEPHHLVVDPEPPPAPAPPSRAERQAAAIERMRAAAAARRGGP